jgi:hypothetical protein
MVSRGKKVKAIVIGFPDMHNNTNTTNWCTTIEKYIFVE